MFAVGIVLALAACGSRDVYAPTTTTSAELAGAPSVTYAITPRGEVRLASYGLAPDAPRIHIGLAVSNRSEETWTVDAREQHLSLAGGAALLADAPEHVDIPPHATRFVDLVFPVELVVGRNGDVPAFDVGWVVHAGKTIVAGTTPFTARASR
jgi:hypothetical protein